MQLQFDCNSKKKSEAVKEFESAEADSVSAFAEFEQLRTKMESIEEVRTFEQLYQQEENSKITSECQKVSDELKNSLAKKLLAKSASQNLR